jgi:hypothetical protein
MIFAISLFGQDNLYYLNKVDTIRINFSNRYFLSSTNIVPFSDSLVLRGKILKRSEYNLFYIESGFSLSDSLEYSIFDTLFVFYKSYKYGLQKEYRNKTLVTKFDVGLQDSIRVIKLDPNAFSGDAIFGKGLQKSGTIVRGFTIGTNKDFTLNSGLRLQLSGNLSDDIEITAALTDENTPIQPEGNSEKLEELDKVFIEIRHKNAVGTFGDYDYNTNVGQFGVFNRKLQGLKTEVMFENFSSNFAYATSRGKFNTNKFNGIDGVQGPYRLTGSNNERNMIIIAGSEKVYLNGELLKRGENNDYTIEYSNAQVTFRPKRLITSVSRITVEFEYSDRQYSRNFLGSNTQVNLLNKKLKIGISYFNESDDKDNPIDLVLSDEDKRILENAGDEQQYASRSGVTEAIPDSLGRVLGSYIKVDTLINSQNYSYYVYNPGSEYAIYNVVFSYVGENKGDYSSVSLGNYRFVGIGKGAYLPIKFLPLPQRKQLGNVLINYDISKDISFILELAGSEYDKNLFSKINDGDNYGFARNLIFDIKPVEFNVFGSDWGKIGLNIKDRYVESRFVSLERINSVEFDRYYNISNETLNNEILREISLNYLPNSFSSIIGKYGYLKRGDSFNSEKYNININSEKNSLFLINYDFDFVKSASGISSGSWLKQNGKFNYVFSFFKPGFEFSTELKKEYYQNKDSLTYNSLKFNELSPTMDIISFYGLNFSYKYTYRDDFNTFLGEFEKFSTSKINSYNLTYKGIREFNTDILLTTRKLDYSKKYLLTGYINSETVLFKSQSKFNFLSDLFNGDLFYETYTEKVSRLEKVFIKVPLGQGNYIYKGDLNNNGIAEENEFEQTIYEGDFIQTTIPTDELFPVINLKLSTRWKIEFNKLNLGSSLWEELLQNLSTETLFRVEENNKESDLKQIYFLNFSKFLNDSLTIRGLNLFQQDIFLFKNSSTLSFRYRYTQKKSLNSYSSGIEKGYFRENTFRIRFALVKEIVNQSDFTFTTDNYLAPVSLNRSRLVNSQTVTTDFSYRPYQMLEVGLIFSVERDEDRFPGKPTIIDINSQGLRVTVSFSGRGRLRIEGERKELTSNQTDNIIPFELLKGNNFGKNYTGSLNFDYRIGSNLQTNVSYSLRKLGSSKIIHTLKAEARAYF